MVQSDKSSGASSKGSGRGASEKKKKKVMGVNMKKAGKTAKHVGKVGVSAARLYARMHNPVNVAKMVHGAATGKGLVLPGSNYIGPGNKMNKKVMHKADANAKQHDIDYDNYLKKGHKAKKVYTKYSDADARLKKKSNTETPEGLATYLGMKGKELAHKAGLTGKRLKDSDKPKEKKKKK
jgi:hypothetical protein